MYSFLFVLRRVSGKTLEFLDEGKNQRGAAVSFSHKYGVFLSEAIVYIGEERAVNPTFPNGASKLSSATPVSSMWWVGRSRRDSTPNRHNYCTPLRRTRNRFCSVCVREPAAAAAEEQKATKQDVWCVWCAARW